MEIKNKIVIITGSTSGIGKVTAKALAAQGAHLVLPVRNMDKGLQLKEHIEVSLTNAQISLYPCDMESLDSVRKFSEFFKSTYEHLDILINNAGVWINKRELTKDGFEKNFGINHLAPFLMTNLLLEQLKKSEQGRIISVSSMAHKFADIDFEDLQSEKSYNSFKAYGRSKLANILFVKKLSMLLKNTKVTANCLHPGVVATSLFNNLGGLSKKMFEMLMISPEKGAETTIYLATSDEVKNISGAYFSKKKIAHSSKFSRRADAADKLWEISLKLTGLS
ncbi:MAG: Fatty acyl-CoA reductase [Bacteroidetes bacterium ADurb.Bin408]|nr:MAG: Fatty acyl-CoA reductase [Bacteroidetes bacterium ADurb.Bin408]